MLTLFEGNGVCINLADEWGTRGFFGISYELDVPNDFSTATSFRNSLV